MKKTSKKLWISSILFLALFMVCMPMKPSRAAAKTSSFKKYYNDVLVKKYGKFKKSQTGVKNEMEDEWMDASGVIGCSVMDFDCDGEKEMLAWVAEPEKDNKSSHLTFYIYEKKNGQIKQAAKKRFNPYQDGKAIDAAGKIGLSTSQWAECSFMVSAVKKKEIVYIICEEQQVWGCFADGQQTDYWILQYKNNKLSYVDSLTQTAGGSSDFVYTAFHFKNGKRSGKEIYYAEEPTDEAKKSKYKAYSEALAHILQPYEIRLNKKNVDAYGAKMFKSVLAKANKPTRLFTLFNKCVKSDYTNRIYKFKATTSAKNNW